MWLTAGYHMLYTVDGLSYALESTPRFRPTTDISGKAFGKKEDSMARSHLQASLCVFFLSLIIGNVAGAQVRTTGQLTGTAVDPSGAVLPGIHVTARDTTTNISESVITNASGQYVFPDLQPGTYELTASAPGFATAIYKDIVIEAARTKDLAIKMKVGQATEHVEVSAQGAVLETTTNTLATTIDPDQVQDLPLAGRDILPLAQLVAGAQTAGDERFTTYNALPNAAVSITIDGMTANSQRYRTSSTGFFTFAPLRLGAFDEVTVSTSDLTADAGAEGSTQIRFVSKRGTNQFHGNAFWQAINSYFDANSYTNNALQIPRPLEVLNDWGGSLGGPLWKDKVFFFFNFEGLNQTFNSTASTDIPTSQAQLGSFTYNGTDNNQHTVNLLSLAASNGLPSTVNSTMAAMLTAINGYTQNTVISPVSGLPYEETTNFVARQPYRERDPTARLDFQITPKVALHSSFDMQWREYQNEYVNYANDPNIGNGFKSTYYVQSNGVDWTITPTLINQANFGIQSDVEMFNPGNSFGAWQPYGNYVITPASLAYGPSIFQPVVPTNSTLPLPRNNPVWSAFDNLTWVRGRHTFTFGGDLRIANSHEQEANTPPSENLGISGLDPASATLFSEGNLATNFPAINQAIDLPNAEALYASLTGRINSISGYSWVSTSDHQYQVLGRAINWEKQTVGGLYIQDSWHTTPHFALNYGFRWQFTGAVHNTDNLWTGPTLADLYGPSTALFQPGTLNGDLNPQVILRPDPYSGDFKQPGGNLGFAWSPTSDSGILGKIAGGSNLVIRGGVQLSRYDEGWTTLEGAALFTNPGSTQSEFLYPGTPGFPCYPTGACLNLGQSFTLNTFPASFTFPQPESEFFPYESYGTVNPNIRPPYVETWNFGIQRKLPGNTLFEINYVGNHSVHMWDVYDLNETNIFENGFLKEFQHAQTDLSLNNNTTFADSTGVAGLIPLPIFDAAFGTSGYAPGGGNPCPPGTPMCNFTSSTYITQLQQGQAGALANQLATTAAFLCNMVGSPFAPCAGYGYTGAGNYPMNFFQLNPFAAGGSLQLLSNPGSESYNGLQVQVKHQAGHGLYLMANYAYSHALTNRYIGDYYTADYALENFVTLRDPNLNRGPSPYDLRHTFRTYLTYNLPFGTGRSFKTGNSVINRVIGGWTVGNIISVQSGRIFKLQGGYNSYNYSNAYWPDASDSGVVLTGITPSQLQSHVGLNPGPDPSEPKVFLPPSLLSSSGTANPSIISPEQTPGQLGQFVYLRGPMFFDADFSIVKSIPITERVKFNIFAEFLNAFNHQNWTVIDSFSGGVNNPGQYANISGTTFSALSPANGPRDIEFRMQLTF